MPEVKIGAVKLELVPETYKPLEHPTWKRVLEREWAWERGTLAGPTGCCSSMALDRSFYYERSEYRLGHLHLYKWILCKNGGIVSLYTDNAGLGQVWTSKVLGEKILDAVPGARVFRNSDEFLCYELLFPLEHIHLVCRLAGDRRSRKAVSGADQERLRQLGFGLRKAGATHCSGRSRGPVITVQRLVKMETILNMGTLWQVF